MVLRIDDRDELVLEERLLEDAWIADGLGHDRRLIWPRGRRSREIKAKRGRRQLPPRIGEDYTKISAILSSGMPIISR